MNLTQDEYDQLALWHVVQHSVSSFNKLINHFDSAAAALHQSAMPIWSQLKLHTNHIQRLKKWHEPLGQDQWKQRLDYIARYCQHVVFKASDYYPPILNHITDAPPVLFIAGALDVLYRPQIAMVGSRQPSPHGQNIAYEFAQYFSQQQWVVISGLAWGIDAASHQGALTRGHTIAVIGTGLDQCYPASHHQLWQDIIQQGGAIVSEFLPCTPPAKQNFPRRNRLISGLSLGTLVVEAGLNSGSLITAKIAAEQGKHVFAIPGHIYNASYQGCHQLIREGATLVDHPQQVIEDLTAFRPLDLLAASIKQPEHASPKPNVQMPEVDLSHDQSPAQIMIPSSIETTSLQIPDHLRSIYTTLDWVGLSFDEIAQSSGFSSSDLSIALVELELLELCIQQHGRYMRHPATRDITL